MEVCYHCGDDCGAKALHHAEKVFCCNGCKTVFDILRDNGLCYYYDMERTPGSSPSATEGRFDFLDNPTILEKLLDFDENGIQIASFVIPAIHCSSCIWVLENLNKLHPDVKTAQVNFPQKSVRITFDSDRISLKKTVELLTAIGYEPSISLEDYNKKEKKMDHSLIYKLGVAGFAFGNIMFLSFPEYFEVNEFWLDRFKYLFRGLIFVFSLPVVFYSGRDYFVSAIKGLRSKILNIDVPIAIGIAVLFIRSTVEVVMDWGTGFFDSLAGLVFFLLLGRFFQQKTYAFLSFERDYKSYFPIAVTRISSGENEKEHQVQVYDLKVGDHILIRNAELIPADALLIKGSALIDYSFVTGEAEPVAKKPGEKLFAGGRQKSGVLEMEVLKTVQQSYLTQLWGNEVFSRDKTATFKSLTQKISRHFTVSVLSIAFTAALFWMFYEPSKALNVLTAVLIVACPCAIALAAPFTLGNLLRIFGKYGLYLKDTNVIEKMAFVNTLVFDKTGTLTTPKENGISYEGTALTVSEKSLLTSTLRASNHPLSKTLYRVLKENNIRTLDEFEEETGRGITGILDKESIRVGSYAFVEDTLVVKTPAVLSQNKARTTVHISANDNYKGCYVFHNQYREGIGELFAKLGENTEIMILSGDNAGERKHLESLLPEGAELLFDQRPEDKLDFIKGLRDNGKSVMMIGDGLNDSGALAQSDVGIAVSENTNMFSPACDGILDAARFGQLATFIDLSKKGTRVIKWSFMLSLMYNLIGLGFAVTGHLRPVVAAVLMPLSSISIVVFTTVMAAWLARDME